jgi:hypothetical protein
MIMVLGQPFMRLGLNDGRTAAPWTHREDM